MIYRKSIGRYADARSISLKDAFVEAWRFEFEVDPNWQEIWGDIRRYKEVGAVPAYVAHFLDTPGVEYVNKMPSFRLPALA